MKLQSTLSNPLLQFFVAGVMIFGLYALHGQSSEQGEQDRIVITQAEQKNLDSLFEKTWQRLPTDEERRGLVEERLQQELLYREALALGLDRDDVVIRRRLAQKIEFIVDDMAAGRSPTDEELTAFLKQNHERYATEPKVSFRQVFLSAERRGPALIEDATRILTELQSGADPLSFGDPSVLPQSMRASSLSSVERVFGKEFSTALAEVPTGSWVGPVHSTFGAHLVQLLEKQTEQAATLETARAQLERDWREAERQRAKDAYIKTLKDKYLIAIEPAPGAGE
ncbi:MAG: peptidylprolyl isomerase [Anderseniella sp.]|jgi:parvulin-like peptidyl-prolyl isomerase|nr:peptidylprolyl isomerase [Anderseniella sp.]